jgi:Transcription factor WhiB
MTTSGLYHRRVTDPDGWRLEAACTGKAETMFGTHPALAIAICANCPVLEPCGDLLATLQQESRRVVGVWAGQHLTYFRRKAPQDA